MGGAHPGGQLRPPREVPHGLQYQALKSDGCGHPSSEVEARGRCAREATVSDTPRVVFRPSGITPDLARYARACAWAYVFECFNHHNGKQGGPATAPEQPERTRDDPATTQHTR